MDGDRGWHELLVALRRDEAGQSTVEYALVLGVLMCVVVALGALSQLLEAGLFVEHALASASHHVGASLGWMADVFSF